MHRTVPVPRRARHNLVRGGLYFWWGLSVFRALYCGPHDSGLLHAHPRAPLRICE